MRMAPRTLVIALIMTGTVACLPPRSGPALHAMQLDRLYFGRNIGDTAVVSDSAWRAFIREEFTPAFPDGATFWEAFGQWRGADGRVIREPSVVVEFLHAASADADARVRRVMDAYRKRFAQEAVLRVVTSVKTSY